MGAGVGGARVDHGQDLASASSSMEATEGFEEVTGSDLCLESVTLAAMKGRDCVAQATQGIVPNPCSTQAGGGAGAGMVGGFGLLV